jgi:hypothetical protein
MCLQVRVRVRGAVEVPPDGSQQGGEVAIHLPRQAALHEWYGPATARGDVVHAVLDEAAPRARAHGVDAAVPPVALHRQRVLLRVHLDGGDVAGVTDRCPVPQDPVGAGARSGAGGFVLGSGGGSEREQRGEDGADRGLDHAGGQPGAGGHGAVLSVV